jgi:hypothetical protein
MRARQALPRMATSIAIRTTPGASITFVISLFTEGVSVYEVVNNGNWYDFGFFVGVATSLGGSGGGAGVRAKRRG